MSKVLVTESYLGGIADAIRLKNGASTTYRPGDMAAAIEALDTSGIHPTGTKNITQNGTHDVTQYASANVSVQPNLQSKTATENGTVTPDQGYDGLSSVVVDVSGGGGSTAWNIPLNRNSDFTAPINSRGKSSYTNEKSLDGWTCTNTTKCDIESNAIRITPVGGNTNMYQQIKAAFTGAMDGQYMTISVMTDTAAASSTFQLNASNVRQGQVTIGNLTFWCNRDSSTVVACGFTVTSTETNGIVIRAAKIEFGSTQTLYRQNGSGYEILQNQDNSIEAILGTNMIANWS